MPWRKDFEFADFGDKPEEVVDYAGDSLIFSNITLNWHEPIEWKKDANRPEWPQGENLQRMGFYALLKDDGRKRQTNEITYIGVAESLHHRLYAPRHPKVGALVKAAGRSRLAYALMGGGGAHKESRLKEVEDILIWTFWSSIENKAGLATMPSMRPTSGKGAKRSRPWIINNTGYGFDRQMPKTIVYPWILLSTARVGE